MDSFTLQQTPETIRARHDLEYALATAPGAQERRERDTAEYYRERRLRAIKRYLRERANRAK